MSWFFTSGGQTHACYVSSAVLGLGIGWAWDEVKGRSQENRGKTLLLRVPQEESGGLSCKEDQECMIFWDPSHSALNGTGWGMRLCSGGGVLCTNSGLTGHHCMGW